jgi:hypothetical protein
VRIRELISTLRPYINEIKKRFGWGGNAYFTDKTKCGPGLLILSEPISREITKGSNSRATICIAHNAGLCSKTGIAFGKDYILDKNPFSYHVPMPKRIKKPSFSIDGKCISFVGPFMDNYCHLILYILINAPLINERFKNYILLFPACLNLIPSMVEAIHLCFPDNRVIYLKEDVYVKQLYKMEVLIDENSIASLREFISINYSHKFLGIGSKNIFVERNGANRRLCVNQKEALKSLPGNYCAVDCSRISFLEQFEIFHHAENIVGIHGAALTNLIFSKNLQMLCEFKDPRNDDLIFKSIAAEVIGAQYHVFYGEPINAKEFKIGQNDINKIGEVLCK